MISCRILALVILLTTLSYRHVGFLSGCFIASTVLFSLLRISWPIFLKRVVLLVPLLLFLLLVNYRLFIPVSLQCTTALLLMSVITNNFDIAQAGKLLKKARVPGYLIEIFLLAFRYSHTFVDDVTNMQKVLFLRGNFLRKNFWKAHFLGALVGNFFVRAYWKSQKVHMAMKLRGY